MTFWSHRQHLGWAALIMGVSILLSRFMGLIRDKVISYFFGATPETDLYFAAFVIPDFINYLLAGAYFSITLIPLLADYFDQDENEGWRFFSTVFTWIVISITLLTALSMFLAQPLARLAAPGLPAKDGLRLAFFLRIILPAQIFFLAGSCLTAVLYLRKQFLIPALTPLIYNLLIILGGIWLKKRGMEGFCWGVLSGAFLGNFLLPYLAVKKGGGLTLRFSFYHPGLKRFLILALPLMVGQSIVALDEQLIRIFGSLAQTGAISWLNYARRIMLVPVGVVAQAAGVASYPFLAELVARKEFGHFYQTLNGALKNTLLLLIPLSIWMMVVSEPTVTLIFQQGRFSPQDTGRTSFLLCVFLSVVFCWGFHQILGRAFYARQDTLTPTILGTITMLLSIPIFYFLTRLLGANGVALASAASVALYTVALGLWWKHRFGADAFAGLWKIIPQMTAFSLASALPAFLAVRYASGHNVHPYLFALFALLLSGLLFGFIFVALLMAFIPTLLQPFLSRLGPVGRALEMMISFRTKLLTRNLKVTK